MAARSVSWPRTRAASARPARPPSRVRVRPEPLRAGACPAAALPLPGHPLFDAFGDAACLVGDICGAGRAPSPVGGLVKAGEPLVAEGMRALVAPRLHRRGEVHDPRVLDELGELRLVEGQRRLVGRLEMLGLDVPARVDLADPAG